MGMCSCRLLQAWRVAGCLWRAPTAALLTSMHPAFTASSRLSADLPHS
jgi:hypothetical protein